MSYSYPFILFYSFWNIYLTFLLLYSTIYPLIKTAILKILLKGYSWKPLENTAVLIILKSSHSYKRKGTPYKDDCKEKSSYQEATLKSCTEMEIALDAIMFDYSVIKNYILCSAATVLNHKQQGDYFNKRKLLVWDFSSLKFNIRFTGCWKHQ